MFRPAANPLRTIPLMIRTLLVSAVLVVPVLAVPAMGGDHGSLIEAPAQKNSGAGFVLLVSLQR